jgi:hypothetical protein
MTHYPKRPAGRYRLDAGRPEGQNDTIVDYFAALAPAEQAAAGVAQRADTCRAIIFDVELDKEHASVIDTERCTECGKSGCPGLSTLLQHPPSNSSSPRRNRYQAL